MVELGQLEKQIAEFKKRNVRLVVVSNDDQPTARETKKDFPGLDVVADTEQKLAKAVEVIHPGASMDGTDTNAPTTFLLDGTGTVRWMFRPDRFLERLSPRELLAAIDANTKS
jgi:peroxiredoxin